MTPQEKLELAANILRMGKALTPDRFPRPDQETAQAWAKAMGKMFDTMPLGIWPDAVELWAMELVTDRMITPKELKHAAYAVRDRWEADPVKREVLEAVRQQRQEERDRQIEAGTFGQLRGYKPRQVAQNNPLGSITRNVGRQVG